MSTSAGNPNSSSSQLSSTVPLITESFGSKAPKEKKHILTSMTGLSWVNTLRYGVVVHEILRGLTFLLAMMILEKCQKISKMTFGMA